MKARRKRAKITPSHRLDSLLPPPATWFDLPQEIKTIIFGMVLETDQIIYIPRDRRLKNDRNWGRAHHFHDLLLVSKAFVSPEDLAFAVLRVCDIKFYSSNELQRFCNEVKSCVKENVLSIHLCRQRRCQDNLQEQESFNGLGGIEALLQSNFPMLKKVTVSSSQRCCNIGVIDGLYHPLNATLTTESVLNSIERGFQQMGSNESSPKASTMVANFAGNFATARSEYHFTRPHPWLRHLVLYSEKSRIEVVFNIQVCIATRSMIRPNEGGFIGARIQLGCRSCEERMFPYRGIDWWNRWSLHLDAQMSSKDWIAKLRFDDREFESYQELAYDMLHVSKNKGTVWWLDLLDRMRSP